MCSTASPTADVSGSCSLLAIDVWSRKLVAWDIAVVESDDIAAVQVQRRTIRKEHFVRPRGLGAIQDHLQPHDLHAHSGNTIRAASLQIWLLGAGRPYPRSHASGFNRQSLLGIPFAPLTTVQTTQVGRSPAWRRPARERRLLGLVQPPTPPQRDQVRYAPSVLQRVCHRVGQQRAHL
jgi:hypothetical protein